jgi:hypothetical protein
MSQGETVRTGRRRRPMGQLGPEVWCGCIGWKFTAEVKVTQLSVGGRWECYNHSEQKHSWGTDCGWLENCPMGWAAAEPSFQPLCRLSSPANPGPTGGVPGSFGKVWSRTQRKYLNCVQSGHVLGKRWFSFCSTGVWTQGLHLEPLHQYFLWWIFSR